MDRDCGEPERHKSALQAPLCTIHPSDNMPTVPNAKHIFLAHPDGTASACAIDRVLTSMVMQARPSRARRRARTRRTRSTSRTRRSAAASCSSRSRSPSTRTCAGG
jgi:hypothetical protein